MQNLIFLLAEIKQNLKAMLSGFKKAFYFVYLPEKVDFQHLQIKKILKNFIDWRENHSAWLNVIKAVPILLWKLLFILPKLIINVIKFMTELIPVSLNTCCLMH